MPSSIACKDNSVVNVATPLASEAFAIRAVDDGDEIAVGAERFTVVNTPGHTQGHMALLHPASGVCFTGDHVLFMLSPSIPLYKDGADSLSTYFASLDKLRALPCTCLFVSHGDPQRSFVQRIDALKAHHLKRERVIEEIVSQAANEGATCGLSGREIIQRIPWRIPFDSVDECDPLQRWSVYAQGVVLLDHMVNTGRLVRVREDLPAGERKPCCANGHERPTFVNRYVLA